MQGFTDLEMLECQFCHLWVHTDSSSLVLCFLPPQLMVNCKFFHVQLAQQMHGASCMRQPLCWSVQEVEWESEELADKHFESCHGKTKTAL